MSDELTEVEKFENLIKRHCALWSEDMSLGMGIKFVRIGGLFLLEMLSMHNAEAVFKKLKDALPADARVVDLGTHGFLHPVVANSNAYMFAYLLPFASKEWPLIRDGEVIPECDFSLQRSDASTSA